MPIISQSETKNPRINQLSARWQQVWLLALERQRKLNDALDRLEEVTAALPGRVGSGARGLRAALAPEVLEISAAA